MKLWLFFLFVIQLTRMAFAEDEDIIHSEPCETGVSSGNVTQVRVQPCDFCSDDTNNEICILKRGTTATVEIDFTATERIESLKTALSYTPGKLEFPFLGMKSDGCKMLKAGTCPLEPGDKATWSAPVKLSEIFPRNKYPLRVRLTDGNKVVACRTFKIELV